MKMKRRLFFAAAFFCFALFPARAQDFAFGDFEDGGGVSGGTGAGPVKISGEVSAELVAYFDDFSSSEKMGNRELGNIFSGSLNFSVSGAAAEAVVNLHVRPDFSGSSQTTPIEIDEAYARAFLGPVNIEGGIRKLTWGKADSFGPLDLINPLDYSDLSALTDPDSLKIARPMIHVSWNMGSFSKLEAVFVPWFKGHSFATEGSWAPSQISGIAPGVAGALSAQYPAFASGLLDWSKAFNIKDYYQDYNTTFEYAQAGMRFTTTVASSDFGIQYYFGRLPRPSVEIGLEDYITSLITDDIKINIGYNSYHHIGVDFARVIAGLNMRAEAGANITGDTDGKDGAVYNPSIVWSLGFDRDLFWAVNLNLQGTGSVRLFNDQLGDNAIVDMEAGKDLSSTRITAKLSRKFFRDELEIKTVSLWGIEDGDFLVMPGIVWSRDDLSVELSAGFFGGDRGGELGQYRNNQFVKALLTYSF
jgi:hypothetical protein